MPPLARELAAFPEVLRKLIDAELAAGNTIVELGHTHPAPPAGGYVRLARKVTTRVRASGDGLVFYERHGSDYSGEFTDARRFHFVIEPPNPPPPEPDMDAIRKALEPRPSPLVRLAEREVGMGVVAAPSLEARIPADGLISTATSTSRHHELHFRDARPPHLIQFALERAMMVLFTGRLTEGVLRFTARANVIGAGYEVELHFVAALARENCYRFIAEVNWGEHAKEDQEYFRTTSASWLRSWTREFTPAPPPRLGEGYGDDPDTIVYRDEGHFLEMLGHFCRLEVTNHAGSAVLTELDTWKLILRRMIDR